MTPLALTVEWGKLGEAVAVSAVVGLVVLLVAAAAVVSSLRAQDVRAGGGGGGAAVYGAATVVSVLALAAIVAYGIWTIAS